MLSDSLPLPFFSFYFFAVTTRADMRPAKKKKKWNQLYFSFSSSLPTRYYSSYSVQHFCLIVITLLDFFFPLRCSLFVYLHFFITVSLLAVFSCVLSFFFFPCSCLHFFFLLLLLFFVYLFSLFKPEFLLACCDAFFVAAFFFFFHF